MRFFELFDFSLVTIPVSVATTLLAVWGWSKLFAEKRLDHEFNRRLEKHKNDLEQITNKKQFEYSLKAHDYNIYSEKRHQVYSEVYYRYSRAMQSMLNVMNENPKSNFFSFGMVRVELLLRNHLNIPDKIVAEVLNNWNESDEYISKLNSFFWNSIVNNAQQSHREATEYYFHNALFLDQEIEELFLVLNDALVEWRSTYLEYIEAHQDLEVRRQIRSEYEAGQQKAELNFRLISEKMRSELKYGKYNDFESTETTKATQ